MIRVFLIDDPQQAGNGLRALLTSHADVKIAGEAGLSEQARVLLAGGDYDLVFFDAQLGEGMARDLVSAVKPDARIIFVTEHDPYAIRAFELARVEFLVKPVPGGSLAEILDRLRAGRTTGAFEPARRLVAVKAGSHFRILYVDDIRLVTSCENYTELILVSEERLLVRRTMQQWAQLLPARQFARVHRQLFVNLAQVSRAQRGTDEQTTLHFNGEAPPVSLERRHAPAVRTALELWRGETRSLSAPPASVAEKSIAVLPFANLGFDSANEDLCDSLTEELINVLAKVPQLRVAARTSSFYFKGKSALVPEIARQLSVAFVVEGSLRIAGDRVRVTAQLVKASDGYRVWSDDFEHDVTDVFAAQDAIARAIAQHLELRLGSRPPFASTSSAEVHWLVLEGRLFWNQRTNDGLLRAEEAFTRALQADATYAAAHAGLADVCIIRAMYRLADGAPDAADDIRRARREAGRAIELSPDLAESHVALACADFLEGRFASAVCEFPRALALNPNYATGHQFFAWTLAAQGRLDDALQTYERAIDLDPLSFINVDRHAAMLALAGRFEAALVVNQRAATLRPDVFVGNLSQRAPILLALGRTKEAIAIARLVRQTGRELRFRRNSDADAIFTLHAAGLPKEAADYAAEILAGLPPENYLTGFILGAIGSFAEAFPALERTPVIMLPQLYWARMWEPVRHHEQFENLIAKIGRTQEYHLARGMRGPKTMDSRPLTVV
jgi:TolB-like protein/DNA-binding LytR/AlgR family response regulator/tetratricopeptide (TPR) repeat protein